LFQLSGDGDPVMVAWSALMVDFVALTGGFIELIDG
jgi:hypothetical protein